MSRGGHSAGTDDWIDRFHGSLSRLCDPGGMRRVLVGVSGGPDSVALLCLMAELRDSMASGAAPAPFPEVLAGHIHHGLRGAEADRDAEFVRRLAVELRVELLLAHEDARGEGRRRRLSPEAAARSLRFRVFRRWAKERDLDAVLLAHHLDDQAETVLLRAVRGAGVRGIGGIPRSRPLAGKALRTRLLRPLLGWSRASILGYLEARGRTCRLDSTNEDLAIPRNRIRHEVLPTLERHVQPGAVRSLARLGRIAGRVARDLRRLAARCLREGRVPGPEGSLSLCAEALRRWPETVLWEVLALAIRSLAPASPFPGAPPRSACRALVAWSRADAPSEALFEFGRRGAEALYRLELRYGAIRITRAAAAAGPPLEELRLQAPGRASWCDWRLEIDEAPRSSLALGFLRGEDPLLEVVDASSVAKAGPLRVRSRHRGERFWPLGSPGEKPLGEFFRERRVWPSERDRVPIVAAGPSIVWVVGHRIDERFRVSDSTERVLVLRASRQP